MQGLCLLFVYFQHINLESLFLCSKPCIVEDSTLHFCVSPKLLLHVEEGNIKVHANKTSHDLQQQPLS